MNVGHGDTLVIYKTASGYMLTACDKEFKETMDVFEEVRREFRTAFRELAK